MAVKSTTWTDKFYDNLTQQGKVDGKIDSVYLNKLKKGVLYWDGKDWTQNVTKISRPPM
jgi:hypothetical protein